MLYGAEKQMYDLHVLSSFPVGPKGGSASSSLVYQSGDIAFLPCDVSVPKSNSAVAAGRGGGGGGGGAAAARDEITLIMWYREDVKSPIYSVDARTGEEGLYREKRGGSLFLVFSVSIPNQYR